MKIKSVNSIRFNLDVLVKINIVLYNIKTIILHKSHDRMDISEKMSSLGKRDDVL